VTLTFKVATQMTRQLDMVIISVKYFQNLISNKKFLARHIWLQGHAVTLTFKVATKMLRATRHLNMVIISVKYFQNQIKSFWPDTYGCKVML